MNGDETTKTPCKAPVRPVASDPEPLSAAWAALSLEGRRAVLGMLIVRAERVGFHVAGYHEMWLAERSACAGGHVECFARPTGQQTPDEPYAVVYRLARPGGGAFLHIGRVAFEAALADARQLHWLTTRILLAIDALDQWQRAKG